MMTIDGKRIAVEVVERLKTRPAPEKFLVALMVSNDPASASFVNQKEKVAKELGVDFRVARYAFDITERELVAAVRKYADDEKCGGVILQLPLPAHLDRAQVIAAIPPEKDVDALRGEGVVLPPAVGVVQEILQTTNHELPVDKVAVVGIGFLVGQPIAQWLKGKAKELVTLDIDDDLRKIKNADVVVLGAGKAGLVTSAMVKDNALVIDFGYSMESGKLKGDFNPEGAEHITYTPTPGGTGPILVAKLFENFYQLNER